MILNLHANFKSTIFHSRASSISIIRRSIFCLTVSNQHNEKKFTLFSNCPYISVHVIPYFQIVKRLLIIDKSILKSFNLLDVSKYNRKLKYTLLIPWFCKNLVRIRSCSHHEHQSLTKVTTIRTVTRRVHRQVHRHKHRRVHRHNHRRVHRQNHCRI